MITDAPATIPSPPHRQINGAANAVIAGRVLVVDDSAPMRELIERILSRDGHVVAHATNGREALRMLPGGAFDLVLTDLFMPDMHGIELIRDLTARSAGLPLVVLSGADMSGAGGLLRAARVFGAAAVLQKPVSPADLREAVHAALRSQEDRRRSLALAA